MTDFTQDLTHRLEELRQQGLARRLRVMDSYQAPVVHLEGRQVLNFSSNDYLGLASHPALKQAAHQAVDRFGAGAGASRLISGSLSPHHQLEETLAAFKGTEAALTFATGYAAALGAITALVEKNDLIIIDKRVHASIIDAARLSDATLRVYPHLNLDKLEHLLKWANSSRSTPVAGPASRRFPRILIVTESLFSMDGDRAPLAELVALKERYGAWLMVDEAHATGLYGSKRRGLVEECDLADHIEIQMGTLGKALGAAGGMICGSRKLIDYLIHRARSFIFSTAPVPAAAAAANAGVEVILSPEGEHRRRLLWDRVAQLKESLAPLGWDFNAHPSPIFPLILGDENRAVDATAMLHKAGLFIPAIRFPTVARGQARLRLTVSAAHTDAHLKELIRVMRAVSREI